MYALLQRSRRGARPSCSLLAIGLTAMLCACGGGGGGGGDTGPDLLSPLTLSASEVTADGIAAAEVRVELRSVRSEPLSGRQLVLRTESLVGLSLGAFAEGATPGVYTARVTSTVAATRTLRVVVVEPDGAIELAWRPAVTFVPGAPSLAESELRVAPSPASVLADGVEAVRIEATIRDAMRNPRGGDRLEAAVIGAHPDIALTAATQTVGASGTATVEVRGCRVESATIELAIVAPTGRLVLGTVPVTFSAAGAVDPSSPVSAPAGSVLADGVAQGVVWATIRSDRGTPLPGRQVAFHVSGVGVIGGGTVLSDAAGRASVSISSVTAGRTVVSAVVDPGPTQTVLAATATLTFAPGDPDPSASTLDVAPGTGVLADGQDRGRIEVVIRDRFGNPVPGASVQLSVSPDLTADRRDVLYPRSGTTSSTGAFLAAMSSSVPGSKTIAASVNGGGTSTPLPRTGIITFTPRPTDQFPGSAVEANNVGRDGEAFNDAMKVNKGLNVWWNEANGHAIVVYANNHEHLIAHYWDGVTFTPGTRLRGPNEFISEGDTDDDWETELAVQVLFLNTAGAEPTAILDRDGDAIIAWTRYDQDLDNGLDPNGDKNIRLFATYFDQSESSHPVSPSDSTVRYGFETMGINVDFDSKVGGTAADRNVTAFGFVSDSLIGSHQYRSQVGRTNSQRGSTSGMEAAGRSGDPTTEVALVWTKGTSLSPVGNHDVRFHMLPFDLNVVGNPLRSEASHGAALMPVPSGYSILVNTDVTSWFAVHNLDVYWVGIATHSSFSGGRGVMFRTSLRGSTRTTEVAVPPSVLSARTATNMRPPDAVNLYGEDHGLNAQYLVGESSENEVVLVQVPPVGPGEAVAVATVARSVVQRPRTSPNSAMPVAWYRSRISRDGSFILCAWIEQTSGVARRVVTTAIQTVRGAEPPRPLALAVATPAVLPNISANIVTGLVLPSDLAGGQDLPGIGFQSNARRIAMACQITDPSNTRRVLLWNAVEISPDVTGSAAPTVRLAVTSPFPAGFVDENAFSFGIPGEGSPVRASWDREMRPVVLDSGQPDGAPVLYYYRNANNPSNALAPGAYAEPRIFGAVATGDGTIRAFTHLVSTAGTGLDFVVNTNVSEGENDDWEQAVYGEHAWLRTITTPLSADGASQPAHSGTYAHVFFYEADRSYSGSGVIRTRALVKQTTYASAADFAAAHRPPLTEESAAIDGTNVTGERSHIPPLLEDDRDEVGPRTAFLAASGDTVGTFFQSERHFLYNEFDGEGWRYFGGVSDPALIDTNAGGGPLFPGRDQQAYCFPSRRLDGTGGLSGAMVFFAKTIGGGDPSQRRWFVRVRDAIGAAGPGPPQ